MFRFEVSTRILVRRRDWGRSDEPIEVRILEKIPNHIKCEVLSEGWWKLGAVVWLDNAHWFVSGKIADAIERINKE